MKKILLLLAACIAMTACKKDDKVQLDPHASIMLNGVTASSSASTKASFEPPYSIQTVAKYAMAIAYTDTEYGKLSKTVLDRDIETGKIRVGQAGDVVVEDGTGGYKLGNMAQGVSDMVCQMMYEADGSTGEWYEPGSEVDTRPLGVLDTIAYVPNAVIRKAEADIAAAFEAGNYELCMSLFETAYTFIPITGAQWLKLKADGVE